MDKNFLLLWTCATDADHEIRLHSGIGNEQPAIQATQTTVPGTIEDLLNVRPLIPTEYHAELPKRPGDLPRR